MAVQRNYEKHKKESSLDTFDMCTPRLLCVPEHLMQMNAPKGKALQVQKKLNGTDAHFG